MSAIAEGQGAGEFIVSEANGTRSREQFPVNTGTTLLDGTPVVKSGNYLIAATTTSVDGIIIGKQAVVSPEGPRDCAYLARDAEVKLAKLNLPTDGTQRANVLIGLAADGIIVR
jgi:hypothetical protein